MRNTPSDGEDGHQPSALQQVAINQVWVTLPWTLVAWIKQSIRLRLILVSAEVSQKTSLIHQSTLHYRGRLKVEQVTFLFIYFFYFILFFFVPVINPSWWSPLTSRHPPATPRDATNYPPPYWNLANLYKSPGLETKPLQFSTGWSSHRSFYHRCCCCLLVVVVALLLLLLAVVRARESPARTAELVQANINSLSLSPSNLISSIKVQFTVSFFFFQSA